MLANSYILSYSLILIYALPHGGTFISMAYSSPGPSASGWRLLITPFSFPLSLVWSPQLYFLPSY